MWIAFLNLENSFGSSNSLNNVFKEALLYNDEKKIYNHMVDICIAKGDKNVRSSVENITVLLLSIIVV